MTILLAGVSAILAGAFSMAGGEYVSVSTQKDTEIAAIEYQKQRLHKHFQEEIRETAKFYEHQGINHKTAEKIAQELMEKHPLQTTVHQKYNLYLGEYTNPWHATFSSLVSFILGSLLPILTIVLFPESLRILVTGISVTVVLFITGFVSASLGSAPRKPAVIRNMIVGWLTMTATYVIGHLFNI
jgi:VIT1/CCC1 family predicted Fe2+/Mn2+ transporter